MNPSKFIKSNVLPLYIHTRFRVYTLLVGHYYNTSMYLSSKTVIKHFTHAHGHYVSNMIIEPIKGTQLLDVIDMSKACIATKE